jgi:replication-associated recombination protein RarA
MYTSPYIGRTGIVDAVLRSKIPLITSGQLTDPIERRILFTGPPGVAKTDLARTLASVIAEHPINVEFRMGTQVNVEVVRDWLRSAPYRPLYGRFLVKIMDELDTVPNTAITELRQYLDDLPPGVVIFATTNKAVQQLPEPLQTRFMVYKFQGVQTSQVAAYLTTKFPEIPPAVLTEIATQTAGNVRAALTDAASHRDVLRFQQLAA